MTDLQKVNKEFEFKKILSDSSISYIYRTNVKLYDNDFSGMIVIKPQSNRHRIVFLNEIGMKFFDIEIMPDSFKVHYIFEPMNKKMFIKLLVSDFKFILMYSIGSEINYYQEKENESYFIKTKQKKEVYCFDQKTLLPQKAFRYSLIRKNTLLTYKEYKDNIPETINIKHKNIKFTLKMTFLK